MTNEHQQFCRQNGDIIECLVKTERGWMAHGLDLRSGRRFLQLLKGEDGVYETFLPENT